MRGAGLIGSRGEADEKMLIDLTDVTPVKSSRRLNGFEAAAQTSEQGRDRRHLAPPRFCARSSCNRDARGDDGGVLDKSPVGISIFGLQFMDREPASPECSAVRPVLDERLGHVGSPLAGTGQSIRKQLARRAHNRMVKSRWALQEIAQDFLS